MVGNLLIHLEQVAVAFLNFFATQTFNGTLEIEEHRQTRFVYAKTGVATFFGGTGSHVTRHQVSESRITAFQVVVALFFGNIHGADFAFAEFFHVFFFFGNPDTAIVTQTFAHQRELALVIAVNGNTGGVNLRKAGIGEESAFLVGFPSRAAVAVHGVGAQEIHISVATRAEQHGVRRIALDRTVHDIATDDTAGVAVFHHHVHHFAAGVHLYAAFCYLVAQSTVGTDQQLLSGLTAGVESTRNLRAAERTVVEITGIVAGKRHALRHTLVNDIVAHFRQTIYVGFAGTVVAPLDGIVEKTVDAVAVVLIVLGRIDTALRGDGVRPAGTVGNAEYLYIETQRAQRSGRRSPSKAGSHHNHIELAFVGGVHQMLFSLIFSPLLRQRPGRNLGI